ncbi:MAG TPA: hypothetical protein VFJ50_05770, partial [Gemmatimonadales bacterium]|nr:hypothetical protein [Gemmatimonadales bacterium]
MAPQTAPPAMTVVANFGIVAGRHATRMEIEKLWQSVGGIVPQAMISVEDHNCFGKHTSTCVHQVSVAVSSEAVRQSKQDPELLRDQLQ